MDTASQAARAATGCHTRPRCPCTSPGSPGAQNARCQSRWFRRSIATSRCLCTAVTRIACHPRLTGYSCAAAGITREKRPLKPTTAQLAWREGNDQNADQRRGEVPDHQPLMTGLERWRTPAQEGPAYGTGQRQDSRGTSRGTNRRPLNLSPRFMRLSGECSSPSGQASRPPRTMRPPRQPSANPPPAPHPPAVPTSRPAPPPSRAAACAAAV